MKVKLLAFIFVLPLLVLPLLSFAQGGGAGTGGTGAGGGAGTGGTGGAAYTPYRINIPNPLRSDINSIPKLIEVIITDLVRPIAAVVVVLMIMYAGFLFVTAGGNQAQVTKARDSLLYGSIGAGILIGAEILAYAIKNTVDQLR